MLIVLTVVIHLQVYMAKQTTLYTLNTVCHLYLNKVVFKKQKFRLSSPNELESLGMELRSPALQADSLPSEPPGKLIMKCLSSVQFSHFVMSNSL